MLDQAVRLREVVNAQTAAVQTGNQPHKISVVSGKGGVGKSNIALNLGIALARDGARVLLVDRNVNLSNLDILSGVSPSHRLFDVIDGTARLKDAAAEISPNDPSDKIPPAIDISAFEEGESGNSQISGV